MALHVFLTVFAIIFMAELPDKTAFATMLMASRGKPFAVFTGVAAAFIVQSLVAVLFGSVIGLLPETWVHAAAGALFLGFAAHTWFFHDKEEKEEEAPKISSRAKFLNAAWKSFMVIFIAEWGDITQLATASLAARFHENLVAVFCSATLALWAVTCIAIFVGRHAGHKIPSEVLKKLSVAVFIGVGAWFLAEACL
jgi:Ca2+/H+ antiporter, TMEM165/GDT1 family